MSIIVDHAERQKEILRKALHLFGQHGYPEVTYRQIADACGLSRTSLYKYFTNKREIFDSALLHLVLSLGEEFQATVKANPTLSEADKLEMVLQQAIDLMLHNPDLLQTILEYILALHRQSEPVARKIRRHTVAFRRTLMNLIRQGVAKGEFAPVDAALASDHIYALMESAAIRIMLSDQVDRGLLVAHGKAVISALKHR
ncbi:MAG: TetR/AcrR family transcriptional regulator [Lentisphaeria bacterium]|jgi:AcrR family transcriptional regulator|nr:TetR/AcrR family transcriptional regulator [Lentisphaeria bacterium]